MKAKRANSDIDLFDPSFVDYASKAVTLYRILVPKLKFDLSTEFRNSSLDNGFEMWRLSSRKLDPRGRMSSSISRMISGSMPRLPALTLSKLSGSLPSWRPRSASLELRQAPTPT